MRRCFVFAAAPLSGLRAFPKEEDFVIAADAGYLHCQRLGIVPDLLLGDFDSMEEPSPPGEPENDSPDLRPLCRAGAFPHVERVPVEKDDTDTMLALKAGLSRGCDTFYIYGGIGGPRLDHSFANLQSLLYLRRRGTSGFLYGEDFVWAVAENERVRIRRAVPDALLSVFSLTDVSRGVTITGVQYPLENGTLQADFPLGVSNHITEESASVSVREGALLLGWQLPPVSGDEGAPDTARPV